MLGKNFSRQHFEILSLFSQKIGIDIPCKLSLERRQFACNDNVYFLGTNKKNIVNLSSA